MAPGPLGMGWKGGSWGEDDKHKGMGVGRVLALGTLGLGMEA